MKRIVFISLVLFFIAAGLNHFRDPEFYLPLIPDYFPAKNSINIISGVLEIILGLGLLIKKIRRDISYLLIVLLLLFIPSHIWFLQVGSCIENGLCTPEWVGWVRLLIIHPLLLAWVYWSGRYRNS